MEKKIENLLLGLAFVALSVWVIVSTNTLGNLVERKFADLNDRLALHEQEFDDFLEDYVEFTATFEQGEEQVEEQTEPDYRVVKGTVVAISPRDGVYILETTTNEFIYAFSGEVEIIVGETVYLVYNTDWDEYYIVK